MEKPVKEILLSLKTEQHQQLTTNQLEYIKSTGKVITLQEFIRIILAGKSNNI